MITQGFRVRGGMGVWIVLNLLLPSFGWKTPRRRFAAEAAPTTAEVAAPTAGVAAPTSEAAPTTAETAATPGRRGLWCGSRFSGDGRHERPPDQSFTIVRGFPARICASTQAPEVVLTTRRTVAWGVRMWAGLAPPLRIGPMTTPSQSTRTML